MTIGSNRVATTKHSGSFDAKPSSIEDEENDIKIDSKHVLNEDHDSERPTKRKRWGTAANTDAVATKAPAGRATAALPSGSEVRENEITKNITNQKQNQNEGGIDNVDVPSVTKTLPTSSVLLAKSIQERLAAIKEKKRKALIPSSSTMFNTSTSITPTRNRTRKKFSSVAPPAAEVNSKNDNDDSGLNQRPVVKRAKVYDFDMTTTKLRTDDDDGNNPFGKAKAESTKKKNPYLAHLDDDGVNNQNEKGDGNNGDDQVILDGRLVGGKVGKQRKRHRPIEFVEPGKYIELANQKRAAAANAIRSGFTSGRKEGTHHKSIGMAIITGGDYYRKSVYDDKDEDDAVTPLFPSNISEMPSVMEWWDLDLLPSKLKKEVVAKEGKDIANRTRKRMDVVSLSSVALSSTTNSNGNVNSISSDSQSNVSTTSGTTTTANASTDSGPATNDDENGKPNKNNKKDIERQQQKQIMELQSKCFILASTSNCKTFPLVQHPAPILSHVKKRSSATSSNPSESNFSNGNVVLTKLHLTKKEMKRQRKLRRAEKRRHEQDLQAAGLAPVPEPRLTLSNFMRVMGQQAVVDPSKMEQAVVAQMKARQLRHEQMNADRALTPAQRSAKRKKKLLKGNENVGGAVSVATFWVRDMSHPYHRAKVDLNAQQMDITGGVLECLPHHPPNDVLSGYMGGAYNEHLTLVIAEGGSKAIKKYIRLMTVRMQWRGENFDEHEGEEKDEDNVPSLTSMAAAENLDDIDADVDEKYVGTHKFNPNNACELVWSGLAPKRMFKSFMFQTCTSYDAARKILEAKAVAHFWDLLMVHIRKKDDGIRIKLGPTENSDDVINSDDHKMHISKVVMDSKIDDESMMDA